MRPGTMNCYSTRKLWGHMAVALRQIHLNPSFQGPSGRLKKGPSVVEDHRSPGRLEKSPSEVGDRSSGHLKKSPSGVEEGCFSVTVEGTTRVAEGSSVPEECTTGVGEGPLGNLNVLPFEVKEGSSVTEGGTTGVEERSSVNKEPSGELKEDSSGLKKPPPAASLKSASGLEDLASLSGCRPRYNVSQLLSLESIQNTIPI